MVRCPPPEDCTRAETKPTATASWMRVLGGPSYGQIRLMRAASAVSTSDTITIEVIGA
jgi:hypothetical protein